MDRELEAIGLIGSRRSRARGLAFCVAWPVMFALLFMVLGVLINGIVSFLLAGMFAEAFMRLRTPGITQKVCADLGIAPGELRADRYLIS